MDNQLGMLRPALVAHADAHGAGKRFEQKDRGYNGAGGPAVRWFVIVLTYPTRNRRGAGPAVTLPWLQLFTVFLPWLFLDGGSDLRFPWHQRARVLSVFFRRSQSGGPPAAASHARPRTAVRRVRERQRRRSARPVALPTCTAPSPEGGRALG